MKIGSPTADTPPPRAKWVALNDPDRLAWVSEILTEAGWSGLIQASKAEKNGYVTVSLTMPLDASERGRILRVIEKQLKHGIDPALTVWLEPAQDRNRPRQLRGVKVL